MSSLPICTSSNGKGHCCEELDADAGPCMSTPGMYKTFRAPDLFL